MPQDFYVFAHNTTGITLKIGNQELAGESLGHGLFRVRTSGSFGDIAGETVRAAIRMGETSHERILKFHKALPHPNRGCRGPKNTAFVLSEETDELFQVTSTGVIHTRTTTAPRLPGHRKQTVGFAYVRECLGLRHGK